jgi:hypothetical protein
MILKIIGIVLLIILLLVLSIIMIILFVPIRYKLEGHYREGNLTGHGKITWLAKIITINLIQKEKYTDLAIKIFGKRINKVKIDDEKVQKEYKEKAAVHHQQVKEAVEDVLEEEANHSIDNHKEEEKKSKINNEKQIGYNKVIKEKEDKSKLKKNRIKRTKLKKEKKIKKNKESYWDKIKRRYQQGKSFFEEEANVKTLKNIYKSLKYLLKKITPKELKLYLKVGTGDPETTGYLLGILSFLYAIKGKDVCIEGDFDDKIIKSQVNVAGKFYFFYLIKIIIQLFLDKNFRKFIVTVKNN